MEREKAELESQFLYQLDIVCMEEIEEAVKKETMSIIKELSTLEEVTNEVVECLIIEPAVSVCTKIGQQEMEVAIIEFSTGKCRCAGEVKLLKEKLAVCRDKIEELFPKVTEQQPQPCALPYCENSLVDDSQAHFFTGLPNMHIFKSVF